MGAQVTTDSCRNPGCSREYCSLHARFYLCSDLLFRLLSRGTFASTIGSKQPCRERSTTRNTPVRVNAAIDGIGDPSR